MGLKFMTLPSILLLHGEEVSFKKEGVTLCVINVKVGGKMGSKKIYIYKYCGHQLVVSQGLGFEFQYKSLSLLGLVLFSDLLTKRLGRNPNSLYSTLNSTQLTDT